MDTVHVPISSHMTDKTSSHDLVDFAKVLRLFGLPPSPRRRQVPLVKLLTALREYQVKVGTKIDEHLIERTLLEHGICESYALTKTDSSATESKLEPTELKSTEGGSTPASEPEKKPWYITAGLTQHNVDWKGVSGTEYLERMVGIRD